MPGTSEILVISPFLPTYTIHNRYLGVNTTVTVKGFDPASVQQYIPAGTAAYVQNAFFVLCTIFSVRELQALPIGQIALRIRASLVEQTTEPQVRALVREQKAAIQATGRPVLFAEADSVLMPVSNWSKAKFFEVVDFGPAVVGGKGAGKPVFYYAFDSNPKPNPMHRNVLNILGKDAGGNYWINGMLSPVAWALVEKELEKL